jgi:hypothetical protein
MGKGKLGGNNMKVKGWKQRWFVLNGSSLYYYNKATVCDHSLLILFPIFSHILESTL